MCKYSDINTIPLQNVFTWCLPYISLESVHKDFQISERHLGWSVCFQWKTSLYSVVTLCGGPSACLAFTELCTSSDILWFRDTTLLSKNICEDKKVQKSAFWVRSVGNKISMLHFSISYFVSCGLPIMLGGVVQWMLSWLLIISDLTKNFAD